MPKVLLGTSAILAALAGYAGYQLWHNQFAPETAEEEAEREELVEEATPEQWNEYEHDVFPFTFSYPPEATSTEENDRAKVTFLGPDNTMGSEITDGFTVFVGTRSGVDTEAIAEEWAEDEAELGTIEESVSATERDGRIGHQFTVETGLGSMVTNYVLETDEDYVLTFSESIIDPAERGHGALVDHIFTSIEL